jgi:hypothetical protein
MRALVLDAGALIAIDRDDRRMLDRLAVATEIGQQVPTNSMVVAQVWRDSRGRQATLAKALRNVVILPVSQEDGRTAGELLAAAGLSDPIDATVALLARPGDHLYTSDSDDLRKLCEAAGNKALVIRC